MLHPYLEKLGFTEKQRKIFLALVELGVQPASVVSNHCKLDRVTTYKNLKKLVDRGLVKMYQRDNIQCFGIESLEHLQTELKEKIQSFSDLLTEFDTIAAFLKSYQRKESFIPQVQIFQGESGMKNFFRDMLFEISSADLKQIRMFTSNTFEERLGEIPLSKFIKDFFREIQKRKLDVEIFEAVGTLVPERLRKMSLDEFDPEKMPASRGTTNIFLAGSAVYLACYKTTQIGLKIKHPEMSQIFHFLFDHVTGSRSGPVTQKV